MASLAEKRIDDVEVEVESVQTEARPEELRLLEALLFAATEPLDQAALAKRMPDGVDVKAALLTLQADYAMRGVNLVRVASKWTFRTAGDLAWLMTRETTETRKLSRAAIEVLAIVAYHQPVTRAEIEDIRGVVTSKGTLDVLLETGWIKPRGRRKTPGRPLTFGTTESFLSQFSLEALTDLPGLEELKGTGLLDSRLPAGFSVPNPSDDPALREDEDPLEDDELQLMLMPAGDLDFTEQAAGDAAAAQQPETAQSEVATTGTDAETSVSDASEFEASELDGPETGLLETETEALETEGLQALDEDETSELETTEAEVSVLDISELEVSELDVSEQEVAELEDAEAGDLESDDSEIDDAEPEAADDDSADGEKDSES